VHEGGYSLTLDGAGRPVFATPNGKLIPNGPDTRFCGNVFELTTGNERERVDIGAGTLVPLWYGDNMDDGMAVQGLIQRE